MHYKISYLTNGTKVKITSQLFNQIKQWETEGVKIDSSFLDELKKQDNEWINSTRQHYRNTLAIESLSIYALNNNKAFRIDDFQNESINRICIYKMLDNLSSYTEVQRRRFLMKYYLGLSYAQISEMEGCSEFAVRKMVQKVEKRLFFEKSLL